MFDHPRRAPRRGLSLLEVMAAVVIVGVLAAVVIPRLGTHGQKARHASCQVNKGNLEVQALLFYRQKGRWPAADLGDLATDPAYLPDGLPVCPVDGAPYQLDPTTGRVLGHSH